MRWITFDPDVVAVDPRERLTRVVANNVASVEFSVPAGGISVNFKSIQPSNDDVGFRMRVSVDDGATFDSGTNYSSGTSYLPTGTEANVFNTSLAQVQFLQEATANAALGSDLSGWLWLRTEQHPATFNFQFAYLDEAGTFRNCKGVGRYTVAGQITAPITNVQFFMETGNIQSGEFLAYRMF